MSEIKGKIIKGIGGFYYVNAANIVYECKAKGIFRKDHRKPLVGDDVTMEILDEEKLLGSITELLPRKSELIRPAVANVDQALVIFAVASPQPALNLLDRFLIMMEQQKLPCLVCFNKEDLGKSGEGKRLCQIYEKAGYQTLLVSAMTGEGLEALAEVLKGRTTTVAGPSGVGKSSLINAVAGREVMETGSISERIERGKHTTRHSELFCIGEDTFILDTPGFSSRDLFAMEKEDLQGFYPDFTEPEKNCRFTLCSHISEPDCGVKAAVEEGRISKERYENYKLLYEELKNKRKY
jgi:ribosome biogenesis GTPase